MVIKPAPIVPIEKEEHFVTHFSVPGWDIGLAIYCKAYAYAGHSKAYTELARWATGDWT